ncbi:MAG: hypothetical protein A2669_00720 [Candidatus Yanofskybacteria bacterium RIFCSPHIGHO2_01_FULL_48_25b]|uniref:Uncharacterized protein n=2 Tax=Parcubacteria group TaxID=1794811 RepID=A0A1F8F189_9BACT|nr:MAG: hypothetical protein A2669_00720 [Candidatus Yanofskybacteria bacterium RIFCSPHIGHO2_01_FULL_48_25b]
MNNKIMASDKHSEFIIIITKLFGVREIISDPFFAVRIQENITSLLKSYINYCLCGRGQKSKPRDLMNSLKLLSDLLEEMRYLKISPAIPLASSQELILRYLRGLMIAGPEEKANDSPPLKTHSDPAPQTQTLPSRKIIAGTNKERIFNFVRQAPERRPKEIIDQFSVLSERTVKRNLKELIREGLITKKQENRAVYYSAS